MITLLILTLGGLALAPGAQDRHAGAIKWPVLSTTKWRIATLLTPVISWVYRLQQKGKYAI